MRFAIPLLSLLVGGTLVLAGCGSSGPAEPGMSVGTPMNTALPASIAHLPFRDAHGTLRHLADFAGKDLVISDTMTLCQETCPLDTAALVETARAANHDGQTSHVEYLTITVDPGRDTPARLADYQKQFGTLPNWLALTGSPAVVHQLWHWFGVYTKKVASDSPAPRDWVTGKPLTYDIEHSDELFFLDAHQHERFLLEGMPHVAGKGAIPQRLYAFMSPEGHKNVSAGGTWSEADALHVLGWELGQRLPA